MLAAVAILLLPILPAHGQSSGDAPARVLVLLSWDQHQPWTAGVVEALHAGNRTAGMPFAFHFEYLDVQRQNAKTADAFAAYIEARYGETPPAAVVAESIPATRFLRARPKLLAGVPRFIAASGLAADDRHDGEVTIPVRQEFAASLAHGLELTGATRVEVFADTRTNGGAARLAAFRKAVDGSDIAVDIAYIENPELPALEARLADLPADTIVYYLLLFDDGVGNRIAPHVALRRLAEASAVPIFTNWEVLVGDGALGGYMLAAERVGARILDALRAEPGEADAATGSTSAYGYYYDWREAFRHGLPLEPLRARGELRHHEPSSFEEHRVEILVAAALIVLLAVLSTALIVAQGQARRANAALARERDGLEARVAERTADLERAIEEALDANRQKTAFLANMSHEIRTPLSGVLGLADLVAESSENETQRGYAEGIQQSGKHLLQIVNDILDLSKISAGRVVLERAPLDLPGLADAARTVFLPTAANKGLHLTVDCTIEDADRVYLGDAFRLRQILFNLTGNALKFTGEGSVTARIEARGDGADRGHLLVTVADTGPGVTPDARETIFDAFVQSGMNQGTETAGTGLGLAICKELVGAMGGEISVESTAGIGSTFTCHIPVPTEPRPKAEAPLPVQKPEDTSTSAEQRALHVLIADDNAVNRMILEAGLANRGYRVSVSQDGAEALAMARDGDFDALILDIHMPKMQGTDVARRLRDDGLYRQRPVIALTADVIADNVARYLDAGFTHCTGKPIDWDALDAAINAPVHAT